MPTSTSFGRMVLAFVRLEEQGHDLMGGQPAIVIDSFDDVDVPLGKVESKVFGFGFG